MDKIYFRSYSPQPPPPPQKKKKEIVKLHCESHKLLCDSYKMFSTICVLFAPLIGYSIENLRNNVW